MGKLSKNELPMLSKLWMSLRIALQNIRANLLHTILSTLGIVIGVAALVTILSLIDGMEQYARGQITSTTSLNSISVESRMRKQVDGVWIDNPDMNLIKLKDLELLKSQLRNRASLVLLSSGSTMIQGAKNNQTAAYFYATSEDSVPMEQAKVIDGTNVFEKQNTALVSATLARAISDSNMKYIIGTNIQIEGTDYNIGGVLESSDESRRSVIFPLSSLSGKKYEEFPPKLLINAEKVEEVGSIKMEVASWLSREYSEVDQNFNIYTSQMRLEQATKGMLLFKLIMGLITGVAVVVGGIGVMNVLLISVTERTTEIGIRKATGAKKFDIIFQFLSESVTVSILGSILGLLLGMLVALASVPIVTYFVDIPFEAGFSLSTMVIISLLAVCVGIIFGTYPAIRAANLTPVEAIRRE